MFFCIGNTISRAIAYQANLRVQGYSGANVFATYMRGYEWSKFQPRIFSGCKVINSLGEDYYS